MDESGLGFRIPGQIGREKLDRHVASEFEVLGSVDNAHASAAKLFEDFEMRYGKPYHGTPIRVVME
jgi:hypothetical protein